ncbi:MAG: diadenosine tetraphosphate (Ap4A) HIT family hydrolase [Lentimonas sp.]|jgi:diadenosine tetraphosphate (Ap4A) HIT family hydrolase
MAKKYDSNNIFAKIIRGEIPCDKVFEDDEILAFNDISKAAPNHILVIPKGEYSSFDDFSQNASVEKIANFFKKTRQIAINQGLENSGYRLITNHGFNASQSVEHFHVHILGGKQLGGLIANDELIR